MKYDSWFVAIVLGLACLQQACAQKALPDPKGGTETSIASGHYATEQGWGWLVVEPPKDGKVHFSVDAQPTPTGGCGGLEGELKGHTGVVRDGENTCTIRFQPTVKGVKLEAETVEACRQFCGLSGGFRGEYSRNANPSCMPGAVAETRDRFKKIYDRKDYSSALSTLQPVLKDCSDLLTELGLGPIRNDVALTQYKNGQREQCLSTLAPYQKDARRSDKAVLQDWGRPDVAADYLAIIKAARTNLRLCSGSR